MYCLLYTRSITVCPHTPQHISNKQGTRQTTTNKEQYKQQQAKNKTNNNKQGTRQRTKTNFQTSISCLLCAFVSSWKVMPLSVRMMGLPLPSTGPVCNDQVSENTPQLGDLKRKGKAR